MCIHNSTTHDCDHCQPSGGLHSSPISHGDERSGERTNHHYTYTPFHASFTSPDTTSTVALASVPILSAIDQSFQSAEDSTYMQHPPPHLINHSFDWLWLSLDPASSGSPLNSTGIPSQFPSLDSNGYLASGSATIETSSLEDTMISSDNLQEIYAPIPAPLPSPPKRDRHPRVQPHGVARHTPQIVRGRKGARQRVHDQPGKKPAAEFEPDATKLRASWQRRGGTDFACQWILTVFKDDVTLDALTRRLKFTEIEGMNFPGGFEPCLAYDGFLEKVDDVFECCLCTVDKRVWWKNKKDAVRHLRKFHFGLGDRCTTCDKILYSTGEMKSHRCVP